MDSRLDRELSTELAERKQTDRRRRIHAVGKERRGGLDRRKECPQCGSTLLCDLQKHADYQQQTLVCTSSACTYTFVQRAVPMGKINLEGSYELELQKVGKDFAIVLPLELCHFAKLEKGQKLRLKTLSKGRWNIEKL